MFEIRRNDGVLQVRRSGTQWFSTGWNGGHVATSTAYSVTVPEGWNRSGDAIESYVVERLEAAGFEPRREGSPVGPVLLTGVEATNVRGARSGPVEVLATAGLSNPAALPIEPEEGPLSDTAGSDSYPEKTGNSNNTGTVNLLVGTSRKLGHAATGNLIAVAAEAKAATLLELVGVPGTTTDAVVIGSDPTGDPAAYTGSGTRVGGAARACVREAIKAALKARYGDADPPAPGEADHPVVTETRAEVFDPTTD